MSLKNYEISDKKRGEFIRKISEVSKKHALAQTTLRYYERIGLIPVINRNENCTRNYNEEDCIWIEFVKKI